MYQPKRLRIGDPQGKLPPLREERAPPQCASRPKNLALSNAAKENIKQAHKASALKRAARQNAAEPVADVIADLPPPGDSFAGARRQNRNPHIYRNLPHAPPRAGTIEFRAIVAEPELPAEQQPASAAEFKPATPVNRHTPTPLLPTDCRR